MFEHDRVHAVPDSHVHDIGGGLYRDGITDAFCTCPQAGHPFCTIALCLVDSAGGFFETVVFCREGKEAPSCDRAVRCKHAAGTCVVDAKVHGKDQLVLCRCIMKFCFFLKGKVQVPFLTPLPEYGDAFLPSATVLQDVVCIRLPEVYCDPVPGVVDPYLYGSRIV